MSLLLWLACAQPAPADSAPVWTGSELALQDCDANLRSLPALAGPEGLVLAIGAAWCTPCQEDAPRMQSFATAHPRVGLAQVLVQDEDAQPATRLACARWVEAWSLEYPVLVDPLFTTADWVGDAGFPVHLVFGPDGALRLNQAGSFDEEALLAAL